MFFLERGQIGSFINPQFQAELAKVKNCSKNVFFLYFLGEIFLEDKFFLISTKMQVFKILNTKY
jgi:hypothetical protein